MLRDATKTVPIHRKSESLEGSAKMSPGGDLWRYAPVRDTQGRALSDLMLLLPGLQKGGTLPVLVRQQLQEVLVGFGDRIQFADLNLRLGILWVTVVSEPGLCGEVAAAIRARIEGARMVCNYMQSKPPEKLPWKVRLKRLLSPPTGQMTSAKGNK
jgi:hypothetical protein